MLSLANVCVVNNKRSSAYTPNLYISNGLTDEFTSTNEIALFTNSNSDIIYRGINESNDDIDPDFSEFAFTASAGDVMGPIFKNNTFKMARVVENGIVAPDSVKLRNIFVYTDNVEKTRALADSIETALKGGANFVALCREFSQSENALANGELGWVRENTPGFDKAIIYKTFSTTGNVYFQLPRCPCFNIFQYE